MFQKSSAERKRLWKGGEGESTKLSRHKFLSLSAEDFRKGTLLSCVSENFRYRKIFWIRGEEESFKFFRGKIFVSHSLKISKEGGWSIKVFRRKTFCLRVPKTFVEEPLCAVFHKVSKSKKFYGSEAGRRLASFSFENFLSHSAEKFRRGILLCCV